MADKTSIETDDATVVEPEQKSGEMSVRDAGKKGGNTVRNRYGSRFYKEIGQKGGKTTRERHGSSFYEAIGQKGGQVVKERYGQEFYEEIGQKGGKTVKFLIAEGKRLLAENAEREIQAHANANALQHEAPVIES